MQDVVAMTIFLPTHARRLYRRTVGYCAYCCRRDKLRKLKRARDGPIDHYFCNDHCVQQWAYHRLRPERTRYLFLQPIKDRVKMAERLNDEEREVISDILPVWRLEYLLRLQPQR